MNDKKLATYEDIKHRIIIQDLKPGDVLKEIELIKQYKIGRTPLREIFLELKGDGFLKLVPRQGTFITPMDINELKRIIEVRIPLELLAGTLAVDRIDETQIKEMQNILLKIEEILQNKNYELKEYIKYESVFHNLLYKASCNYLLKDYLKKLQAMSMRFWYYINFGKDKNLLQINDLHEIVTAIKQRDKKKIRAVLKKHITKYYKSAIINLY